MGALAESTPMESTARGVLFHRCDRARGAPGAAEGRRSQPLTVDRRMDDTQSVGGASSVLRRGTLAVFAVASFLLATTLAFRFIQLRIWNHLNWIDLLVMTALMAPFLASRWPLPPRSRWTHVAWWLCALMALDVLAFAVGLLAPTGGHPSLEAVASLFLGAGKVALVPAAVLCLVVAALRGERVTTVLLGTMCLIGQTLYTLVHPDQPIGWFAWLQRPGT